MAATLFYLTRNEHALRKVAEEVRSKFNDAEEIVYGATLSSCTYLRACIDEAMRLSPSVGGILPREVLPGGIKIEGERIPAGTVVGVPHYTIHHNEAYYPQPFQYMPERWTAGAENPLSQSLDRKTTSDEVSLASSAFCPFSIGPRGCIGKNLAYVEMTITLARTIFLYDMRRAVGIQDPAEGRKDLEWGRQRESEMQLVDTFTSAKQGVMVEFREVQRE
jgi:cytochrome P450